MVLNALQKELVEKGFAEEPKPRKQRKQKNFKCRVCGAPMNIIEDSNIMTCSSDRCRNYFLFDSAR